jgi:hypothetical protein
MPALTQADHDRLRTWSAEIAETLLPPDSRREDHGTDWRFTKSGGLAICKMNGAWFAHAAGKGAYDTVKLIAVLKQCNSAEAEAWAVRWLASHAGSGSCIGQDEDAEGSAAATLANAQRAKEVLAEAESVDGTVAETYLRSRGLAPPYPDAVKCLRDARTGEGALVGLLCARGVVVGAQVTYLDPLGRKSLRTPVRQTFIADPGRGRGVFFVVQEGADKNGVIMIGEGMEDGLSLRACGRMEAIIAVPGISRLQHLDARRGQRFLVVRDGDASGSTADKGLVKGIDHLLLAGANVRVTATPEDEDANSILTKDGVAALSALVDAAVSAALSLDGEVERLARLDPAEYDQQRHGIAKKFGIRIGTLEGMVKKARPPRKPDGGAGRPEDEPWEGDVDLFDCMNAALAEIARYIVASRPTLAVIVSWAVHTHIVHNEKVRLQKTPRLHVRSRTPGAGKTTVLHCLAALSRRARISASYTASTLLRTMGATKPTLLADESDNILGDTNSEMLAILNAGDRRASAYVERSVPTADGGWEAREFCVWGAIAFAGINELPPTLQDRSISLLFRRALAQDVPEQLVNGNSPKMIDLRRQLTAWSEALDELPDADLPAMLHTQPARFSDNWRPLFNIAVLAGGDWPTLITESIETQLHEEMRPTKVMRLLRSIRRAFDSQAERDGKTAPNVLAERPDNPERLTTETLIKYLLDEPEEEWASANRGRALNAYYLRDQLPIDTTWLAGMASGDGESAKASPRLRAGTI